MGKPVEPLVVHATNAPSKWRDGDFSKLMASSAQTDGALDLIEQFVYDGKDNEYIHEHPPCDGIYIISGRCTVNISGEQISGTPGTFIATSSEREQLLTINEPHTHILFFYFPTTSHLVGPTELLQGRLTPPPEETLRQKLHEVDLSAEEEALSPVVPRDIEMMHASTFPLPPSPVPSFTANSLELPHFTTMNGCWTILADGTQTQDRYTLLEVLFRQGLIIPARLWTRSCEILYVFDGTLSVTLDGNKYEATKGTLIFVPPGTYFSARVETETAYCMNLHLGSGFERLVTATGIERRGVKMAPQGIARGIARGKVMGVGVRERLMEAIGLKEVGLEHVPPGV